MKTVVIIAAVLMCVGVAYAWDDEGTSETYQKYDTYGSDLNPPGSTTNPYVTEHTNRDGSKETWETHQKIWTPPGQENNPITQPGTRLNPYVTEHTNRDGSKETWETHQKIWTPPGQENSPIAQPGTRLNPYITERVK